MDADLNNFLALPNSNPKSPSFFATQDQKVRDNKLRSRLEEVLGKLDDALFESIKPLARVNFERAIVKYMDGAYTQLSESQCRQDVNRGSSPPSQIPAPHRGHKRASISQGDMNSSSKSTKLKQEKLSFFSSSTQRSGQNDSQLKSEPKTVNKFTVDQSQWKDDHRFIGSIQATAWCTRQGRNLVHFDEKLRINRSGQLKSASGFKGKDDHTVRFYNSADLGFARACSEEARFMAVLLDTGVATFDATVIYADPFLKVGSTVIVMVNCYLSATAFSPTSSFKLGYAKKSYDDESSETLEERLVSLRQVALVDMFNRLKLSDSALTTEESEKEQVGDETNDEMDSDQLRIFYKNAESARASIEGDGATPSSSFALALYPYQKRGLDWMLSCEQEEGENNLTEREIHPLWTELKWPEGDSFWANLHSGELSLEKPTLALKSRGGILADEMGLGKTISILALVHSGTEETNNHSTLIVAPMSLLSQWESEIQRSTIDSVHCGCLVYYGSITSASKHHLRDFIASRKHRIKVIVTSYGVVTSEFKHIRQQKESGELFKTVFDRVILDEAQLIKNRTTITAKACFEILAHRRWVLTGTPVVNRLEDLYSLVRFIGVEPWDNFKFWRSFITEKFQKHETREVAMRTVQAVVAPLLLRRTKAMRDPKTGQPLVQLPKKRVEIKKINFTKDEKDLYSHLFTRIRSSVQAKVDDGTSASKYSAILALLLRLRQVCCHPLLLRKLYHVCDGNENLGKNESSIENGELLTDLVAPEENLKLDLSPDITRMVESFANTTPSIQYTSDTLRQVLDNPLENEECAICSEYQSEPVLTECLHSACRECMMTHIEYLKKRGDKPLCHICRSPIDTSRLFAVNRKTNQLHPITNCFQSSKIRALLSALRSSAVKGVGKAVVFSQFTSFLDIIEVSLNEAGYSTFRFDGSMNQNKRADSISGFKASDDPSAILLLSQKAGGVGLNLVVAKQAYLMDPWWNFATESQAIDRIHRMGQTSEVTITRFIIEGSIEERMLDIQDRKRELSNLVTDEQKKVENVENIKHLLDITDENKP